MPAGRELAVGRESRSWSNLHKKKIIKESKPYSRSCFPGGYSWGLIVHLPLSPVFHLALLQAPLFPSSLLSRWAANATLGAEPPPAWLFPGKYRDTASAFTPLTRCDARAVSLYVTAKRMGACRQQRGHVVGAQRAPPKPDPWLRFSPSLPCRRHQTSPFSPLPLHGPGAVGAGWQAQHSNGFSL